MFYTYLWLREDGTPYYVGKGQGDRAFRSGSHLVPCPPDLSRILIQELPSEDDALSAERFLISYYGRMDLGTGCLRNLTDGGEKPPSRKGAKMPPESIRRTLETKRRIGYSHSEETKRKIGAANKGRYVGLTIPPERRDKIIRALMGNKRTLGRKQSDEEKQRRSVSMLRFKQKQRFRNAIFRRYVVFIREGYETPLTVWPLSGGCNFYGN